jgi:hypothetical protein
MAITHEELKERLAIEIDEVTLLDILEVNSEELVEAFDEKIEKKRHQLLSLLGEDEDE